MSKPYRIAPGCMLNLHPLHYGPRDKPDVDRRWLRTIKKVLAWYEAHPEGRMHIEWHDNGLTLAEFHVWLQHWASQRINMRAGEMPYWRKLDEDYAAGLAHDIWIIRSLRSDPRLNLSYLHFSEPELQRRLGHLLTRKGQGQ